MSVILRFERDPAGLRDVSDDPITSEVGNPEEELLRQKVSLIIDDQLVLDAQVPLLMFAFGVLDDVEALPQKRVARIAIPGGSLLLTLELDDAGMVAAHESCDDRRGTVPYAELLQEWRRFAREARAYLLEEFPGLANHFQVGPWFSETIPE